MLICVTDMKKSKAVLQSGVLDDEEGFIQDFDAQTLNESRAVLCVVRFLTVFQPLIDRCSTDFRLTLVRPFDAAYALLCARWLVRQGGEGLLEVRRFAVLGFLSLSGQVCHIFGLYRLCSCRMRRRRRRCRGTLWIGSWRTCGFS